MSFQPLLAPRLWPIPYIPYRKPWRPVLLENRGKVQAWQGGAPRGSASRAAGAPPIFPFWRGPARLNKTPLGALLAFEKKVVRENGLGIKDSQRVKTFFKRPMKWQSGVGAGLRPTNLCERAKAFFIPGEGEACRLPSSYHTRCEVSAWLRASKEKGTREPVSGPRLFVHLPNKRCGVPVN